ncbi:MAG: putative HAF family extracellular repeat protein [Lentimonas sp.]|jgi:probable HAF family extracellular repeat protein
MKTNKDQFIICQSVIMLRVGYADPALLTPEQALEIVTNRRAEKELRAKATRLALKSVPALDERVIERSDSNILVRRVAPVAEQLQADTDTVKESVQIANDLNPFEQAMEINFETISMAANIYGDEHSEITWRDTETRQEFTIWTNVNMRYLRPIPSNSAGNTHYDYFGFIHPYDYEAELERVKRAEELGYDAQSRWKESPILFSDEYYEYVVIAEDSTIVPEKLYRQLDTVLSYYLSNKAELEIRHHNAQTMEAARKLSLNENPPEPVDSVTNFWPSKNSVYLKKNRTYFVQRTDDLTGEWIYGPLIEPGQGVPVEWGFSSTSDKFFLRLCYTDRLTVDPNSEAFRWADDVMQGLGFIEDGTGSYPSAVSADGTVIVGRAGNSLGTWEAFRWAEDSMQGLGTLGGNISEAHAVSADGAVVIGYSRNSNGNGEAFRWIGGDMQGLGNLGGNYSDAQAISANGNIVVGNSLNSAAFRWTQVSQIQSIADWLAESGVAIEEEFAHSFATAVSDDGNTVVGNSVTAHGAESAWLARGGSGVISIDEFTQTFGTTASVQQTSLALPSTIMNGSHHRVLMQLDFLDRNQMVWVNGDFAAHDRRDADLWLGEVGGAYDFSPALRGGVGVGYGNMEQNLTFDGSHELDGQYLLGELDYQIPETQLIVSLLGIYGDWDADIERGYTNSGTPEKSRGSTDVETVSARIRVDWVDAFDLLGWSFSPRAAFSVTRIETDSYTETGGGFPASFDSMSHTAEEFRFGLTGERMLAEKTTVRGFFEAVYRFDEDNDDFSGEVIRLFDFSISGASNEQDWIRGGTEVSHRITGHQMLTATIFGATPGEDPEMTIGLNYQWLF